MEVELMVTMEEDIQHAFPKSLRVIASFSSDGRIRPLYAEYEDYTIKIDRVIQEKEVVDLGVDAIEYLCSYVQEDRRRDIRIRYAIEFHRWYLPTR